MHSYDPITEYCVKCGVAHTEGLGVKCDQVGNCVGVSHIIALKHLKGLVRDESTSPEQFKPFTR